MIVSLWVFIILHHGFHDAWPVTTHQVPWRHQLHHGSWWGFYMEALSALQLFVREIYQWPLTKSPEGINCIIWHEEAVTWESFLHYWPFVRVNHQWPLTKSPEGTNCTICHDEAVTWKHFLNYWPLWEETTSDHSPGPLKAPAVPYVMVRLWHGSIFWITSLCDGNPLVMVVPLTTKGSQNFDDFFVVSFNKLLN